MNKKYLPWIAAAVIVLAVLAIFQWRDLANRGTPPPTPSADNSKLDSNEEIIPTSDSSQGNTIVGILKTSDDMQKGNLMVVTTEHNIYLHTSRDYSSLLDKEVVVTIDGTEHSFSLIDIKAK